VKFLSRVVRKKNNSSLRAAGAFLGFGVVALVFSVLLNLQVVAFIGLGLTFWGAIFALTRNGKYVESTILDSSAKSSYATIDRMINDLKFSGQGYYIPAYPQDVVLPEYLKNLKDPVVFIAENFDGKASVDELAAGKFLSSRTQGVFLIAPGSGIMSQMEKQLRMDLSKVNLQDLTELIPKCLTEMFSLTRTAEMTLLPDGANFKAAGNIYESFYRTDTPLKSVRMLGCPVVSAVASAFAKSSGKTVVIKEQTLSAGNCGVNVVFGFVG
jgi:hypothetical protein